MEMYALFFHSGNELVMNLTFESWLTKKAPQNCIILFTGLALTVNPVM